MTNLNRMHTRPIDVPRSLRLDAPKVLTSLPAGKVVPISFVPLLREDAVRRGKMRLTFEMQETAEILMNAVYVDVKAYLVPWLAFERFSGSMDIFDRSYAGLPPFEGGDPIDFVEHMTLGAHGSKPLFKYLGLHGKSDAQVNTMIAETYNAIWNFRAQNRSPEIEKRLALDTSLAPAFWRHENFAHIVPNVDLAVIDGEVALNVVNSRMPVMGIGFQATEIPGLSSTGGVRNLADGSTVTSAASGTENRWTSATASNQNVSVRVQDGNNSFPDIFAELARDGITISLSKIEQAKKAQWFARLRERYSEHSEEHVIDMLMSGLTIPDQQLKQPILLAERTNVFGMNKRYSTDADALMASAVNGVSMAELDIRVPKLATGGVIMVTAEVTPEQLFERKKDAFFHLGSVPELPDYLRDELDDQRVEEVKNDYVDVDHDTPNGLFGFAPMNHKWQRVGYFIGGKFHRPEVDASTDEDRQRLWAVETQNPVLSEDFFLCTTMHTKPFLDTVSDPFECAAVGEFVIEGNTLFGGVLVEAMNNYQAVMDKAPTERLEMPETP